MQTLTQLDITGLNIAQIQRFIVEYLQIYHLVEQTLHFNYRVQFCVGIRNPPKKLAHMPRTRSFWFFSSSERRKSDEKMIKCMKVKDI